MNTGSYSLARHAVRKLNDVELSRARLAPPIVMNGLNSGLHMVAAAELWS